MNGTVRYRFRPLQWEGPSTPPDQRRSRYSFKAGYPDTIRRLGHELAALDVDEAVIEAGFREQDLRLDGLPRTNARQPTHPGIRVAFTGRHGPLIYATDAYDVWHHNLRAIALGLEALRAVDRYGITRRGEQYRGFAAIGAAPPADPWRDALRRLGELARVPVPTALTEADIDGTYRAAARYCHPDAGGSTAMFQELQSLMKTLRKEHR